MPFGFRREMLNNLVHKYTKWTVEDTNLIFLNKCTRFALAGYFSKLKPCINVFIPKVI